MHYWRILHINSYSERIIQSTSKECEVGEYMPDFNSSPDANDLPKQSISDNSMEEHEGFYLKRIIKCEIL